MAEAKTAVKASDDNMMGALAYLLGIITGVIMYVMYKDKSKYVAFHGMQSIIFSAIAFVVWIVVLIVGMVLMIIPVIGWIIGIILWFGMVVVFLGAWIYLMYNAYKGVKFKLPVIGALAEKYA